MLLYRPWRRHIERIRHAIAQGDRTENDFVYATGHDTQNQDIPSNDKGSICLAGRMDAATGHRRNDDLIEHETRVSIFL